ncbi:SPFH domain-containing protein [Streptomyces sp. BI20]|uniref:SPFH domain-containing protein n=1 Tax=Streptomyces sp. BI20 TaxID=3403460 RepID=UPI003C738359
MERTAIRYEDPAAAGHSGARLGAGAAEAAPTPYPARDPLGAVGAERRTDRPLPTGNRTAEPLPTANRATDPFPPAGTAVPPAEHAWHRAPERSEQATRDASRIEDRDDDRVRPRSDAPAPIPTEAPTPAPDSAPLSAGARTSDRAPLSAPARTSAPAPGLAQAPTPTFAPAQGQVSPGASASAQARMATPDRAPAQAQAPTPAPAGVQAPVRASTPVPDPASAPVRTHEPVPAQAAVAVSDPIPTPAPTPVPVAAAAPGPDFASMPAVADAPVHVRVRRGPTIGVPARLLPARAHSGIPGPAPVAGPLAARSAPTPAAPAPTAPATTAPAPAPTAPAPTGGGAGRAADVAARAVAVGLARAAAEEGGAVPFAPPPSASAGRVPRDLDLHSQDRGRPASIPVPAGPRPGAPAPARYASGAPRTSASASLTPVAHQGPRHELSARLSAASDPVLRAPRGDERLREVRGPALPGIVALLLAALALAGCAALLWRAGVVPRDLARVLDLRPRPYRGMTPVRWAPIAGLSMFALLAVGGLSRGRSGHAWVLTLFGRYRGTVRRTGLLWVSPLLTRRRVDVRLRHWRSEPMPAVDAGGLALRVVVQVVWQIRDSARATLAVEDHIDFLAEQVESSMARVLSRLPADAFHEDAPTLRDAEAVGACLTRMLAAETEAVGIEVFSAQPTRIEYAPEVAEAMRRRRVAAIEAKHRDSVLNSIVDAVDDTVTRLTSRGLVELDDYERKALVKDLTVAFSTGRVD